MRAATLGRTQHHPLRQSELAGKLHSLSHLFSEEVLIADVPAKRTRMHVVSPLEIRTPIVRSFVDTGDHPCTRVILKLLSVMFGQVGRVDDVLNSIAQQND